VPLNIIKGFLPIRATEALILTTAYISCELRNGWLPLWCSCLFQAVH